jgi:hypothetical protein
MCLTSWANHEPDSSLQWSGGGKSFGLLLAFFLTFFWPLFRYFIRPFLWDLFGPFFGTLSVRDRAKLRFSVDFGPFLCDLFGPLFGHRGRGTSSWFSFMGSWLPAPVMSSSVPLPKVMVSATSVIGSAHLLAAIVPGSTNQSRGFLVPMVGSDTYGSRYRLWPLISPGRFRAVPSFVCEFGVRSRFSLAVLPGVNGWCHLCVCDLLAVYRPGRRWPGIWATKIDSGTEPKARTPRRSESNRYRSHEEPQLSPAAGELRSSSSRSC